VMETWYEDRGEGELLVRAEGADPSGLTVG
jgi:hypothetical protein